MARMKERLYHRISESIPHSELGSQIFDQLLNLFGCNWDNPHAPHGSNVGFESN